MKEIEVNLNSIEKVKHFVEKTSKLLTDVSVKSKDNHYVVDGKSIMGIFSLDLSKKVVISFDEDEIEFEKYLRTL